MFVALKSTNASVNLTETLPVLLILIIKGRGGFSEDLKELQTVPLCYVALKSLQKTIKSIL